jgi:maleylacetoacetate isomerase
MLRLYTYHRSTAAYRVRIALNYKNIPHELVSINLIASEQRGDEYKKQNPQGRVPTMIDGEVKIGQSAAILEYLEEKYPERPLLPKEIKNCAWVRYLSQIVVSDMHPVMNNSSVVAYLKNKRGFTESQVQQWYHHWLKQGFDALEANLKTHPDCDNFCYGKTPTFADLCLIPQIYNAHKYHFAMEPYPTLQRIYEYCSKLDYFKKAKPENQFDYADVNQL